MLQAGGNPSINQPISMMRAEHVDHGTMLERLEALTNDATPPYGACTTWRALYAGVAKFRDDLINHIHLENNILFAQFDVLSLAARHPVVKKSSAPKIIPIRLVPSGDSATDAVSLYQEQVKLYPRAVAGWYARWRWVMVWATQVVFMVFRGWYGAAGRPSSLILPTASS